MKLFFSFVFICILFAQPVFGQNSDEDIAMQLANPIAAVYLVPLQFNYDENYGADDKGSRLTLNIQPVLPFSLTENWNLISRTILPVIYQDDIVDNDDQTGLGDTVQSLFFSPKKPTNSGWILGAGPVFLLPTATDDALGGEKWGAGPTVVALRQVGPCTYGALANHIWSFEGDNNRADVNATFLQPFLSYVTDNAWTYTLLSESTYNWEAEKWNVPIIAIVSKLIKIGKLPVQLAGGVRYWLETPDAGPEGFGLRSTITIMLPK